MSAHQLKTTLQTFMDEIWNQGKFDQLAQLVAPAYTVRHDPRDPWEGQTLDHAQFVQRVMYSRNAFPDLHFAIEEMVAEDNRVVSAWTMSGTHLGDLPNLPATGRPFAIPGMTIYDFEAGKVCGHRQSFDQFGFVAQMGILGS